MAYLFFVDESGGDRRNTFYEVLAGIVVQDRDVWNLITSLNMLEEQIFGLRYSKVKEEIKGKKFLKAKVFRLARQLDESGAEKCENSRKSASLMEEKMQPKNI